MPEPSRSRATFELDDGDVLLEHDVGIATPEGLRLSCDVYRPNRSGRFPALLEHIPYRKDDLEASGDRATGIFMARRGFATVRLDVRGTGSSEGVAQDEYTLEEQHDGVAAVAWIAEQRWCTGSVGSWGVSYGGFACIQLAALQPPALRAIAPVYATDDRYTDDMHFSGGALCALELAHYPIRILAMNALPPLRGPEESDRDFRARWLERIEATPPWIVRWLKEQHDGPYWRNGSLRPDPSRIRCPALIVAGWRDGYRTAMLRLASSLSTDWQLLAGPWMHTLPDRGIPGPRYPFMDELVQWFGRHLGGSAPESDEESRPRTVFFLCEFDPPSRPPTQVSGRWLASSRWPEDLAPTKVLHLTPGGALSGKEPPDSARVEVPFGPAVGVTSGNWCPPPPGHGLPADQRPDDARSACFSSDPLTEAIEVFGQPVAHLQVEHPGPAALVSVKLSDVAADGQTQLVTSGVLNLAHRAGHERPKPFSGVADVRVDLQATGWRFRPGHRIRLAIAGSDWPTVWPLPTMVAPTLHVGGDQGCRIELPGLPMDAIPFEPRRLVPNDLDQPDWEEHQMPSTWRIVTDAMNATSGIEASDAWGAQSRDQRIRVEEARRYRALVQESDPLDAEVEGDATFRVDRPDVAVRSTARGRFGATGEAFVYDVSLEVSENGRPIYDRRWRGSVPRRLC
jgi:uncharacterized protein